MSCDSQGRYSTAASIRCIKLYSPTLWHRAEHDPPPSVSQEGPWFSEAAKRQGENNPESIRAQGIAHITAQDAMGAMQALDAAVRLEGETTQGSAAWIRVQRAQLLAALGRYLCPDPITSFLRTHKHPRA